MKTFNQFLKSVNESENKNSSIENSIQYSELWNYIKDLTVKEVKSMKHYLNQKFNKYAEQYLIDSIFDLSKSNEENKISNLFYFDKSKKSELDVDYGKANSKISIEAYTHLLDKWTYEKDGTDKKYKYSYIKNYDTDQSNYNSELMEINIVYSNRTYKNQKNIKQIYMYFTSVDDDIMFNANLTEKYEENQYLEIIENLKKDLIHIDIMNIIDIENIFKKYKFVFY